MCDAHKQLTGPYAIERIGTMTQDRIIRKYANRRLYDTQASRHVTLSDLRELINAGHRIKVLDDRSGEDLTRAVLLQIIADQEQFGVPVLSSELLEMIIRYYASPMQSMFTAYLEQGFRALMQQQDSLRSDVNKLLSATPLAPFVNLARSNMEALAKLQSGFFGVPAGAAPRGPEGAAPGGAAPDSAAPESAAAGSGRPAGAAPPATDAAAPPAGGSPDQNPSTDKTR